MMIKQIPVLLITGYLGSGKTTLLNRILNNKRGIKFAVIVNDIGEVNIDANLIEQGGVVGKKDDSLVALQNGCICCTLKMDLVEQLHDITCMDKFDYIAIEASGICEPEPIAQTICSIPQMGKKYLENGLARLDCIVTVVDALRMRDEFGCGDDLMKKHIGEEDIENLVIQQVEFCNKILLNKVDEVSPEELDRIKKIIRALQPKAEILECNYGDVDFDKILHTGLFNFEKVVTSATWIRELEGHHDEDEHEHKEEHEHEHEHEDHEHHHHDHDHEEDEEGHHHHGHHHHHHHDEGEAEEYGIGTFVYYRRPAFNLENFDHFVATKWPKNVIRAKGVCYFTDEPDMCYLFEQAGQQKTIRQAGKFYATMPENELQRMLDTDPTLRRDWDETYGDRMQK
ncbi:MAG: GTP-binding protein, partial [Bacteroidales bacterium]|nr:GTP-binding protein [Bacteroidales bacterium]MDY4142791.1 GTP-binding protein [Sodaliphilus sp.]